MELNPGPKYTKSFSYFSLCYWNIDSLPADDFSKLSLIEAYNVHCNFDLIHLSVTCLDSSYADDDTRLNLKDFTLIRADNPHSSIRGRVNIYFKEYLTIHLVGPLSLNECLILEINIQNKKGYVISLYRSPSQSKDEFDHFLLNVETNLTEWVQILTFSNWSL